MEKLAVKRLSASDLTFFEWHFRHGNAGNQKAINLNADVFKDDLYPVVDVVAKNSSDRLGVDLWIAGPDGASPFNLQRKIIKGRSYKNWRLDGEFIYDPQEEPGRFQVLTPRDLVVIGFEGELAPTAVTVVCLARAADIDRPIVELLDSLLGHHSMVRLRVEQLRSVCEHPSVSRRHPLWMLVTDEDIVDAGAGMWPAVARVSKRILEGTCPAMSLDDLRKGRAIAEATGRLGELLVDKYLGDLRDSGRIEDYDWTADVNAVAPFDFHVRHSGQWERWEIKTTSSNFSRHYYLPRSELREMAHGGEAYRLGRVFGAHRNRGQMRLSVNLADFGRVILESCATLPERVMLNGVTITPDENQFGETIDLALPSEGRH